MGVSLWRVMAVLGVLLATPAAADGAKRFVVLDLSAPPLVKNLGRSLSMAVAVEAKKQGHEVIDTRALARQVGKDRAAQAVGCGTDPDCLAQELEGVDADRVIAGTFNKTETHYQVRLVHVDLATRQVVSTLERDILIASRALARDVKAGAPELLKGEPEKTGTLKVTSTVDGAEVFVDGRSMGRTPDVVIRLKPGKHELQVKRENYLTVDRFVQIVAEQEAVQDIPLFLVPGKAPPPKVEVIAGPDGPIAPGEQVKTGLPLPPMIAAGVAVVALGGGVGLGLKAGAVERSAVDGDGDGILDLTRADALGGRAAARGANILFGIAGAGAIAAVALWVLPDALAGKKDAPEAEPAGELTLVPTLTPDGRGAAVVLGGRF